MSFDMIENENKRVKNYKGYIYKVIKTKKTFVSEPKWFCWIYDQKGSLMDFDFYETNGYIYLKAAENKCKHRIEQYIKWKEGNNG